MPFTGSPLEVYMTLSDLIVEYLEQFGVEYVFGVPGSPLGPLFDALARSERRGGDRKSVV